MALRFPRPVWSDWRAAIRDLADTLSSFLRDDAQPERYATRVNPAQCLNPASGAVTAGRPTWDSAEAALAFTANTNCTIQGCFELPPTWKEQTTVTPYLHIYPDATATADGSIVTQWVLRHRWIVDGSSVPSTWTTTTRTYTLSAGLRIQQRAELLDITATAKLYPSVIQWEVTRRPGDATDTYPGSIFLMGVDFLHWADTSRGSQRPHNKWLTSS